jgi:hypothetical protein
VCVCLCVCERLLLLLSYLFDCPILALQPFSDSCSLPRPLLQWKEI